MIKVMMNNQLKSFYKWHEKNGIYVKGYGYINNVYYEGKSFLAHFSNVTNENDFKKRLHAINGIVSVIIINDEKVYAATDKIGAFEIYYSKVKNDLYISDQVKSIMKETDQKKINLNGKKDFIYTSVILYGETLIENIHSINARKYLLYDGEIKIDVHYTIEYGTKDYSDYHDIKKQFDEVVHKVAKRLVDSLNNREVLVPLSGGMDSRFVLLLLKKMNYPKVTCFSYGSKYFSERKIAKKIALDNGFKFLDIPYKRNEWKQLFTTNKHKAYFTQNSNYQNMVHTMDYFAANQINVSNCVVLPGHYGAIEKTYFDEMISSTKAADLYIHQCLYFYSKNNQLIKSYLQKRVSKYFEGFDQLKDIYSQQQRFDCIVQDGYRSKHVIKALKSYEFNELEWRVPLLDEDIISFMSKIPIEFKGSKKKFLGLYTNEHFNHYKYYKPSKRVLYKVIRNVFDRRYACISIKDVLSFSFNDVPLPKKIPLLYGMYRNFLSYITIKNYQILERDINE